MLIGTDFEKIQWHFLGCDLLEPNAFIGDTLLALLAIFIAVKVNLISDGSKKFNYLEWHFIVLAASLLMGGIGHLMWNYWGIQGKYFAWYTSILSGFFVEKAMIQNYAMKATMKFWNIFAAIKFSAAILLLTMIVFVYDLSILPELGLAIPFGYFGITMVFSFILIPLFNRNSASLKYWILSLLMVVPAPVLQFYKVNLAPWFDRNDMSHLLLGMSMIFMWRGISAVSVRSTARVVKTRTSSSHTLINQL